MNKTTEMRKMVNGSVVVALVIACLAVSPLLAAFGEGAAGTKTAQFLKLPVGAHYIGMGEAATAIANDANAIYYNVAGLARLEKKSAEYMYAGYAVSSKGDSETNPGQHWIAFAMPISETIGSAGLGIQYYTAGDIKKTDVSNKNLGTFTPTDLAVNLAYARKLSDVSLGLDMKIISSKIENSATTVALDLGAQYDKLLENKLLLGMAVQNMGGTLKYDADGSGLPILIKLGAGYKVLENFVTAMDIVFPNDNSPTFALGGDYKYAINEELNVSGRLGYNSRARKVDGFNGMTIGFGVGFKMGLLDFAWQPMGDIGSTYKISVGAKF